MYTLDPLEQSCTTDHSSKMSLMPSKKKDSKIHNYETIPFLLDVGILINIDGGRLSMKLKNRYEL
jgi:hypothetical protein